MGDGKDNDDLTEPGLDIGSTQSRMNDTRSGPIRMAMVSFVCIQMYIGVLYDTYCLLLFLVIFITFLSLMIHVPLAQSRRAVGLRVYYGGTIGYTSQRLQEPIQAQSFPDASSSCHGKVLILRFCDGLIV